MPSQNYIVDRGKAPRAVTPQEAYDYMNKGFMNRLGQYAPYAIMAGMGYGAATAAGGGGLLASYGASPAVASAGTGVTAAQSAAALAAATGAKVGLGSTLLKYGLQYGLPTVVNALGARSQANAQRDSDRTMAGYYDKALAAEEEERKYRRAFDEDARDYGRRTSEEDRRYGRYSDTYRRDSDEEILRYARTKDEYARLSDEEILRYGRAKDEYSRLSDEEKLAYGRAEDIRDKNYGYQQYGNFVETLEPYRASGSAATSRMSQLIGGPATPDTGSYLNLAKTARDSVRAVPTVPDRPTWNYDGKRPEWNYTGTRPTWNYTPGETGVGVGAGTGQRQSGMLAADAPDGATDTRMNPMPTSGTQPFGGGGVVKPLSDHGLRVIMRSPDGEEQEVPADLASYYESRGAVRV